MAREIAELSKEQMNVLFLYSQLLYSRFGKTKKDKYQEIAKRMNISEFTIKNWIIKYFTEYQKYISEIIPQKDLKSLGLKGLTERQSKYFFARVDGKSAEEAKIIAGYSENTKVDTIEKTKGVSTTMAALREELIEDTKIGARAIINSLSDIQRRAKEGVKVVEYVDEVNPDGKLVRKIIREQKSFAAEIAATKEINQMLGFYYGVEAKSKPSEIGEVELRIAQLKEKKLSKEVEERSGASKHLE